MPQQLPHQERTTWYALRGYVAAAAGVGVATGVSSLARGAFSESDIVMVYLGCIATVATIFGRGPSTAAAALSAVSFDIFFIPPVYRFWVQNPRDVLTFATMFGAGLLISELSDRVRRNERRARTEEMRSSLLSTVSHDLRTPLAVITGSATTLRDDAASLSLEQRDDLIVTICEEADRMERLVSNLLDMTRLTFGSLDVARTWSSLEDIIVSSIARVERGLVGREARIDLPEEPILLFVDPLLMGQVFVNLLENSIKYTPVGSPLEVRGRTIGGTIDIEFSDRGPGIPVELREQVFERFVRGSETNRPGAGLGLAICRGVVEAHGGSIAAVGREGGGASIRISLPVTLNAPRLPEHRPGGAAA